MKKVVAVSGKTLGARQNHMPAPEVHEKQPVHDHQVHDVDDPEKEKCMERGLPEGDAVQNPVQPAS